ncbi:predicted protein, partial [Nematostella vectensis]
MATFAADFFPPDFSNWELYLKEMVVTVQIALWGTVLAIVLAIPLGILCSENIVPWWVYQPIRRVMDACRSINEMVFAMLFVVAVGLGPFAGVLALFIGTTGVLAKLFAEAVEAIDPGPVEGVRATGASALQEVIYGVIPQVLPLWISYSLYRFESNVRSATVVGMVGAGGIGVILWEAIRGFQFAQTCALLLHDRGLGHAVEADVQGIADGGTGRQCDADSDGGGGAQFSVAEGAVVVGVGVDGHGRCGGGGGVTDHSAVRARCRGVAGGIGNGGGGADGLAIGRTGDIKGHAIGDLRLGQHDRGLGHAVEADVQGIADGGTGRQCDADSDGGGGAQFSVAEGAVVVGVGVDGHGRCGGGGGVTDHSAVRARCRGVAGGIGNGGGGADGLAIGRTGDIKGHAIGDLRLGQHDRGLGHAVEADVQ